MPRLKTVVAEPRGSRTGTDGSAKAKKAQPVLGRKKRSGNSPGKTIAKAPKERVFLTTDQQALLILRYKELPKAKQKKSKELRELCQEFDVNLQYPQQLCAKLMESKELPTRDGVGGAPVQKRRWSSCHYNPRRACLSRQHTRSIQKTKSRIWCK